MNTMFRAATVAAVVVCASVIPTLAQDEPPETPAPMPAPVAIIHDVQSATEGAVHKVQADVEKQMHDAQQRMVSLKDRVFKLRNGSPTTRKSLVIRSSDMAPRAESDLEEDMTIMAHILDKTLAEQPNDDQAGPVAMGISVSFVPGESPTRNLYLDGYGAVFLLNVNFPLLPPPAENSVGKEREPADSTWEEAREEVYGPPGTKSWSAIPRPQYDANKVAALKKALLDALKNASNIRGVRSDESITVCVIGTPSLSPARLTESSGGGGGFGRAGGGSGDPFNALPGSREGYAPKYWVYTTGNDESSDRTTLTIRVKKADCQAFASGKLSPDEFRKRATITIYGDATPKP